ncbi:PNPH phosphorylase, partial [Calyptomena viridis]|nr:PNPH phosphorylase [Calyptomena viridis]
IPPSYEACSEASAWLRERLREPPKVALVCGSGLGALAQELSDPQSFNYGDIPHFPRSTVQGHAGRLLVGRLGAVPCAVLQGRFHLYEGYSPAQVSHAPGFGVRVWGSMGWFLELKTSNLQHKGLVWEVKTGNAGQHRIPDVPEPIPRFGPRFPAMTAGYDPALRRLALALAPPELHARPGVYVGVGGPSYETWAECRLLRRVGGARHVGLRVLGLSLITNAAPGDEDEEEEEGQSGGAGPRPATPPGHEEVLAAAQEGARHLRRLLVALAPQLGEGGHG